VERSAGCQIRRRILGEQRQLVAPLARDGRGRREHKRRALETAHDLQPDHSLARAGWCDEVGRATSSGPVGLERLERDPLVGTKRSLELQRGERLAAL
jgi:hypothetical protein